jgi:hypothetical protein
MRLLFMMLGLSLGLFSCRDGMKYKEEELFLDYQITGEEGSDSVSILVQFRAWGSQGPTVVLLKNAEVSLDGEKIKLQDGLKTGPLYAMVRPLHDFAGKHEIVFRNSKGTEYKREFHYSPFSLEDSLPGIEKGHEGFKLAVRGLNNGDRVRIMLTDTSYAGKETDRFDTVMNGHIQIRASDLAGLKSGPLQLEVSKEEEDDLGGRDQMDGFITVCYTVRKELFLSLPPDSSRIR